MAREIKFRAWYTPFSGSKFGQKFVYGNKVFSLQSMNPDRYVLEQYTGMTDINGAEIYEGDLLKDVDDGFVIGEVKFLDGMWLVADNFLSDVRLNEVIGNIHENLDLIKAVD